MTAAPAIIEAQFELTVDSRIVTEVCPPERREDLVSRLPLALWVVLPAVKLPKSWTQCDCTVGYDVIADERNREALLKLGMFKRNTVVPAVCACYGRLIE